MQTIPVIETAVPGTLKAWFDPPFSCRELAPGPWSDEPNKIQWVDAATKLPCLIVRGGVGALCGYAGIYPTHPYHHRDYDQVEVDVHGGLTFSDSCRHSKDEAQGVCHVPEPGTSGDVWWFGFDCAHCYDLAPSMSSLGFTERGTYRDVAYVAAQVTSLAAQLDVLGDVSSSVVGL